MKSKLKSLISAITLIVLLPAIMISCSDDDTEPGADSVTDFDGNEYQTVTIGDQQWMAENLRVTHYRNGDEIPTGLSDQEWQNTTSGATAIYDHNDWRAEGVASSVEMVDAYGKLYNWFAVDDPRGLCPDDDWRVPTDEDWTELMEYLEEVGFPNSNEQHGAAYALKSCRQVDASAGGDCDTSQHPRWEAAPTWIDGYPGFDEFGFSALPGGLRGVTGEYAYLGTHGRWWSSTEHTVNNALFQVMVLSNGDIDRLNLSKKSGFSVRCVRDVD